MSLAKTKEAKEIFGNSVVNTVLEMLFVCDADGVYSTFQDMGMDEHAECGEKERSNRRACGF